MNVLLRNAFYYPDGPSERELNELRQSYRRNNIPGLFISEKEYVDFAILLKDLVAERKPEEANGGSAAVENAVIESIEDGAVEDKVTAAESENADNTEVTEDELFIKAELYSLEALTEANRLMNEANREKGKTHALTKRFEKMQKQGGERRMVELPEMWESRLDMLDERYPNFSAVLNLIRIECQLASMSLHPVIKLPPILLCGAPGIGKSAFVMDLAQQMGNLYFSHSMETSQHGSALCGSSSYWSNTKTGLVFDALVDHISINPWFLVDELDKASTDSRYDPVAPLYRLLEQKQAEQFSDESIPELAINASYITWFFTANDITRISPPILNRLHVFDVPSPTIEQGRGIVRRLFSDTIDSMILSIRDHDAQQSLVGMKINENAVSMLAAISVRQAKMKLRTAIVKALVNRSRVLCARDLVEPIDLSTITVVAGETGAH